MQAPSNPGKNSTRIESQKDLCSTGNVECISISIIQPELSATLHAEDPSCPPVHASSDSLCKAPEAVTLR